MNNDSGPLRIFRVASSYHCCPPSPTLKPLLSTMKMEVVFYLTFSFGVEQPTVLDSWYKGAFLGRFASDSMFDS